MRRVWNGGEEGTCLRRGVVLFSLLWVFCFVVSLAHRRSLAPLLPPPTLLFCCRLPVLSLQFPLHNFVSLHFIFFLSAGFFLWAQRFSERGVYLRLKKGERLSSSCVCLICLSLPCLPKLVLIDVSFSNFYIPYPPSPPPPPPPPGLYFLSSCTTVGKIISLILSGFFPILFLEACVWNVCLFLLPWLSTSLSLVVVIIFSRYAIYVS